MRNDQSAQLYAAGREAGHAANDGDRALAERIERASHGGPDVHPAFLAGWRSARQEG